MGIRSQGNPVKFFFPSSIAVYGFKNYSEKKAAGTISENNSFNILFLNNSSQ